MGDPTCVKRRTRRPEAVWDWSRLACGPVVQRPVIPEAVGLDDEALVREPESVSLPRTHCFVSGARGSGPRGPGGGEDLEVGVRRAGRLWRSRRVASSRPRAHLCAGRAPRGASPGRPDRACHASLTARSSGVASVRWRDRSGRPGDARGELDRHKGEPGAGKLATLLDRHTFRLSDSDPRGPLRPWPSAAHFPVPLTKQLGPRLRTDFWFLTKASSSRPTGLRYHRTPAQQAAMAKRDQAHTASGLRVLRFTPLADRLAPDEYADVLRPHPAAPPPMHLPCRDPEPFRMRLQPARAAYGNGSHP